VGVVIMSPLRWLSLAFRLFAIAMIIVSPWLAPRSRPNNARSVVFVVDRSASVGSSGISRAKLIVQQAWAERRDVKLGVVAFDGSAQVLAPVGAPEAPDFGAGDDSQSSDLAAGIRLAHASLPREGHRSIVLLSDARPTRGDAAAEVRRAADRGIRVDVVPLEGDVEERAVLASVKPRATHVAEHQPVTLDVEVATKESVIVRWKRDGVSLPAQPVWIRQQRQANPFDGDGDGDGDKHSEPDTATQKIELRDPDPPPGVHVYEVKLDTDQWRLGKKSEPEAPAAGTLTAVSVDGKAHAAVFSSSGEVPPVLRAALTELGLEARSFAIERAGDPALYSGADLIVLADIRLSGASTDDGGLTRSGQTALVDYVQQGGGLLVTGGVFGFAPEYAGTPLARALPIDIEDRGHVEDPPVALAIMLDRSGSMAAQVGEHTKIELAIEASLAAADVLRPTDHLALGSVDTETHWDIPLGPVQHVAALKDKVRSVEAGGGGIYVYTALKDAYRAIDHGPKNPIRHVILFSDTSDSEEQTGECGDEGWGGCPGGKPAETLAREARARGITTTVVGIGEEDAPHTPFLRRLAAAAGGRFYITSEGTDLRRIFLSETRVLAQSNLREKKSAVSAAGPHPVLAGIDPAKLPPVSAYVETGRRAGADTALVVDDGRPMLATWRYGLGKVGAVATDLSEGWGALSTSGAGAQLLKQTARFLVRQNDAHRADAEVTLHDHVVDVSIDLPPDAPESAAPRSIEGWAVDRNGKARPLAVPLERRGPGRWTGHARSGGEPIVILRARDARGALMAEAVGQEDQRVEVSGTGVDTAFAEELARVGDGRFRPSMTEVLSRTNRPGRELRATWPDALVVAAMLVVIDLVLRRLGARRGRASEVRDAMRVARPVSLVCSAHETTSRRSVSP
jgi:uncharacterized membrane protein